MTHGLHHVTAIAGSARRNLDFYSRVLGLRLVKKTVNFDDPGTHHFYYGDEAGRPGTILTFFPWEQAAPGRIGAGQAQETAFRVPQGSIGYWTQRFVETGVRHETPSGRFGETVLAFTDPDGLALALVGVVGAEGEPTWTGVVPAEHAIRGFHGITLLVRDAAPTGAILTDVFGFAKAGRESALVRFETEGGVGSVVNIRAVGDVLPGRMGGGSVHHVAFRAADDAAQGAMQQKLAETHGLPTTEQQDRTYFRSVYFREPGGVLFEIATDSPGFAIDEPAATLGQALMLPARYEPQRRTIEAALPSLEAA